MTGTILKTLRVILFPLLWVLSAVYGMAVRIRYTLYAAGVLKSGKLDAAVACVGNLTAGGTGKTTTVVRLARDLSSSGVRTAVLTRGYRRRKGGAGVLAVSDGSRMLAGVEQSGDEAYLMAQELEGVPVLVGSSRYDSGRTAIERFGSRVLLLDDGLQHIQLKRDRNIVLVDCLNPFGGGFLLPLGFLREPVTGLKRASLIALTHSDLVSEEEAEGIKERISRTAPGIPVIKTGHAPSGVINASTGEKYGTEWLRGRKSALVSSLGNPLSFEMTVRGAGADVEAAYRYMDHYWYRGGELADILRKHETVMTTRKDAVKVSGLKGIDTALLDRLHVLEVELNIIEGEEEWLKMIREIREIRKI